VIITKYGISLIRLKREHIELVRQKRNLPHIQEKMIYKKKVSKWQQKRWFESINNLYNYYFLIQYNGDFIGLVNGKNADFDNMTMEGGVFIWDKTYWNSIVPMMATIIMHDCSFFISKFKTLTAKVEINNAKALQFNKSLGYKIVQSNKEFFQMELTIEGYLMATEKIRKSIAQLTKDAEPLSTNNISFEDEDEKSLKQLYNPLPKELYNNYFKQNLSDV